MRSLSRTLVLGTTLTAAAIFVAAGVLFYALVRAGLLAQFDHAMLDKARFLASTVEREHDRLDLEFDEFDMHEFRGSHPPGYLQILAEDGSTVYRSWAAGGLPATPGRLETARSHPIRLPDGRKGRAVSLAFLPRGEARQIAAEAEEPPPPASRTGGGNTLVLVLARSTEAIDQTLGRLIGYLLLVGLAAVAASTATLRGLVRLSVRPLERLAAEIGSLGEEDLAGRVGQEAAPCEIRPVIQRLNDLLGRLDAAFCRERAFSANVAHELRNPLAALRMKMDVATSKARQPQEYQQAIADCRQITAGLQEMVEQLLALARLDAGQFELHPQPIRLDELLRELWPPLEETARSRGLEVEWSLEPDLSVVSDRALLAVALRNVLENAVIHAGENGTVRVTAATSGPAVELSVANSGSVLSQAEAERALDRFWRGDPARTQAGVRCGLGLSLAQKSLSALGGAVSVRSQAGGDFQVTLAVPGGNGG